MTGFFLYRLLVYVLNWLRKKKCEFHHSSTLINLQLNHTHTHGFSHIQAFFLILQ